MDSPIVYCRQCGHVLSGRLDIGVDYYATIESEEGMKGFDIDWYITSFGSGEVPEHIRTVAIHDGEVFFSEDFFGGLKSLLEDYKDPPGRMITDGKHTYIEASWIIKKIPRMSAGIQSIKTSVLKGRKLH